MKNKITILFALLLGISVSTYAQKNGLNFDGTNDYVQTTVSPIAGNTAKTVEAWIRTTANALPPSSGGTGQKVILDMGSMINGQRFTFNLLWSNGIRLEVGGNGISDNTAVNDGLWHHVCCVYDPSLSSNQVKLYLDGVLKTQGNLTVSVNTASSTNIVIGRRIDNINYFNGDIDEVRVWNVARTATEIANNYNTELCAPYPSGLYAYFRLNQGTAASTNTPVTTAYNQLSNGNGTLNGFALSGISSNWVAGKNLPGSSSSSMNISQCTPYTTAGGQIISNTGIFFDTFVNAMGCDSIITYNAFIGGSLSSQTISQCDPYTSPTGNTYTSSGTYLDTLTNAAGCDSIIATVLTILNASSSSQSVTECTSYTSASGNVYTTSGTYLDTIANSIGCDSIITTQLTITGSSSSTYSVQECSSSYTDVFGNTYTASGVYSYTTTGADGCDSIIELNLQITMIDTSVTSTDSTLTADHPTASYQWLDCATGLPVAGANSQTFQPTASGSYQVAITLNGCTDTSECHLVEVPVIEGIENIYNGQIKLYPNPVLEVLSIEAQALIHQVEIYSVVGQLGQHHTIDHSTHAELSLEELPSGVYWVRVHTDRGIYTQKITKD